MILDAKKKDEIGKLIIQTCKTFGISALIFKTKIDGYHFNIIFDKDEE